MQHIYFETAFSDISLLQKIYQAAADLVSMLALNGKMLQNMHVYFMAAANSFN